MKKLKMSMTIKKGVHVCFSIPGNTEFPKRRRAGFGGSCLVGDFEHFNFLPLEFSPTREKHLPVQSGVVGVTATKVHSVTKVFVALIRNSDVIKPWTPAGMTNDCIVLPLGFQRKSPRREVVRILQREKETF
jgi:hypothetical protein